MPNDTALPETWRPVAGYELAYEVSDQGRVRSLDRHVECGGGHRRSYTQLRRGRLLNASVTRSGYMQVGLGRSYHPLVHKLVLEAFVGPAPDGTQCCHGNGVRHDNRLANLRWGTVSDNAQDQLLHGTNRNRRKTTCPRGHALAAPNLRRKALERGKRECLACGRAHSRRRSAREKGLPIPDLKLLADAYYNAIVVGEAA